jgi:hypothetical protein
MMGAGSLPATHPSKLNHHIFKQTLQNIKLGRTMMPMSGASTNSIRIKMHRIHSIVNQMDLELNITS